jgi:hypothetical protein
MCAAAAQQHHRKHQQTIAFEHEAEAMRLAEPTQNA